MANRNTFPTFPDSAQDALFFQTLDSLAQKFGASADVLTPNQVQSLNPSSRRGALYDIIVRLNTIMGGFNGGVDGLGTLRVARATFNPSANTGERTVAPHGLGVTIPDNAIVVGFNFDVVTTFTSAGADAGTIAYHVQGAGDLLAAIAISAAGDIHDAGQHAGLPGNWALDGNALTAIAMAAARAATFIKLTAAREITATVAGQALTAGKVNLFVHYLIGD